MRPLSSTVRGMTARKYHFGGRVQGVGFRYATKELAKGFDILGTVKNLDDGRVELCVVGEEGELDAFIEEIHESPLGHHIKEQEVHTIVPDEGIKGFQIIT